MYWFLDEEDKVLYVGKAKVLKNRVRSYSKVEALSQRIRQMVETAVRVKWQELGSELEAILTEAELIRLHQPEFNVLLKDDKTPLYIVITDQAFPEVKTVRKKELVLGNWRGQVIGPFASAQVVKEVLVAVRPIFRWCQHPNQKSGQACFYHHLELCSGACVNSISADDYRQNLNDLVAFLRGKTRQVRSLLTEKMKKAAADQKFEQAASWRDSVEAINKLIDQPYRFKPNLVLPQLKQSRIEEGLIALRGLLSEQLKLPKNLPLERIEGYDVSNLQGENAAVAQVTFIKGEPDTDQYRLFNIKTIKGPNDYGMLQEALLRRQNHPEWGRPDLLVIDGGKGQLRSALKAWHWSNPVISLVKNPDRILIPRINAEDKLEVKMIRLPDQHLALTLVQSIRDEAHRFSKRQYSRRHLRHMLG